MTYEIKRFPFSGTVDADGHILEPPTLWEDYLEARFQPRALRIRVDDEGYEYLEIDQQPSKRSRRGSLGLLGAMGDTDMRPRPERRYAENMPFGSADPVERLSLMAQENLEYCLLWRQAGADRTAHAVGCTGLGGGVGAVSNVAPRRAGGRLRMDWRYARSPRRL